MARVYDVGGGSSLHASGVGNGDGVAGVGGLRRGGAGRHRQADDYGEGERG